MGHTFLSVHFVQAVPALLKVMIASEDHKEKFACALQNACPLIIRKSQGKRQFQSIVSKTLYYGLLKAELYRRRFSRNVPERSYFIKYV